MRVKDIISKYKGATKEDLRKSLSTVHASLVRENMGKADDPSAHGRIRLLRYEKAVISQALKVVEK